MKHSFIWQSKRDGKGEGEWLIGALTQNISYLSTLATQQKLRQRRVRCLLMSVKAREGAGAYNVG